MACAAAGAAGAGVAVVQVVERKKASAEERHTTTWAQCLQRLSPKVLCDNVRDDVESSGGADGPAHAISVQTQHRHELLPTELPRWAG